MKYQPPYGMSDPEAPYINGDPTIARQGSIPPAAAFEFPMREIDAVIRKSKLNPTDADLMQVAKGIRSHRMNYSEDTGGVNSLVVAYDPAFTAYTLGLRLNVKIRNTVTGPTTINAGAGTVNVIRADGSILQDGDLPAGCVAALVFDGTSFQVINFFGKGGGDVTGGDVTTYITKLPYVVDTGTVPGQILAPFNPAFTELVAGDAMLVKLAQTCPGVSTIRVNALPPKPVLASDSGQCLQGDYIAGDVKVFVYDGTNFYIQPNPLITASVTYNIPSQWPDFETLQMALQRKIISKNATVTIKFAVGIFPEFHINHHSGDRISVVGTMKAAAPIPTEYTQTGNNSYDASVNLGMLRSRYGTEIQSTTNMGISNIGPGSPIVSDILIVGAAAGCSGVGLNIGYPDIDRSINLNNIVAIYCAQGFYGLGPARLNYCCATGCGVGFGSINGGVLGMGTCHAISNSYVGFLCVNGSQLTLYGGVSNANAQYGHYCSNGSNCNLTALTALNNAYADMFAAAGSIITASACVFSTSSPARNTEGNMASMVSG